MKLGGIARADTALTKSQKERLKQRFEVWKRAQGIGPQDRVDANPVFREALRSLIEDHGYGLTDVSMFLGVSRERVRQWAKDGRITDQRGPKKRIWDDEQNRFVCVASVREYHRRVRQLTPKYRHTGDGSLGRKRWRIARWVLMDLKADMERTPGYMDMVEVFEFRYPAAFASFVGMNQRKRSRADLCRELWAAAGLDYPNYARGGLGRPGKVHKPLSVSVTEGGRMADEMMVNIRRGLYAAGAKPERRVTDGTVVDRPGYLDGQICRVRSGDTPVRFESQADG